MRSSSNIAFLPSTSLHSCFAFLSCPGAFCLIIVEAHCGFCLLHRIVRATHKTGTPCKVTSWLAPFHASSRMHVVDLLLCFNVFFCISCSCPMSHVCRAHEVPSGCKCALVDVELCWRAGMRMDVGVGGCGGAWVREVWATPETKKTKPGLSRTNFDFD